MSDGVEPQDLGGGGHASRGRAVLPAVGVDRERDGVARADRWDRRAALTAATRASRPDDATSLACTMSSATVAASTRCMRLTTR